MKPFALESNMLTLRGVFYPTGHLFIMFPTEKDARDAENQLLHKGVRGDAVSLLTPMEIHEKIAATAVREYEELAREGHHALLVRAPTERETEHVMDVLRSAKISYAQKYRHLVIEDLVA